jgi:hypothetical protein
VEREVTTMHTDSIAGTGKFRNRGKYIKLINNYSRIMTAVIEPRLLAPSSGSSNQFASSELL